MGSGSPHGARRCYARRRIPAHEGRARPVGADGRFENSSVWALVRRRQVWLQGCVADAGQATELEIVVRRIDDVEGVVDELMPGTQGRPTYEVAR